MLPILTMLFEVWVVHEKSVVVIFRWVEAEMACDTETLVEIGIPWGWSHCLKEVLALGGVASPPYGGGRATGLADMYDVVAWSSVVVLGSIATLVDHWSGFELLTLVVVDDVSVTPCPT